MTFWQGLVTVGVLCLGTMLTRFLPFLLFRDKTNTPGLIVYLGRVLPCAMIALLVIFCLKDTHLTAAPFGLPELAGVAAVAALHVWKGNTFLSIGAGTVLYMLLIRLV